ncbi:hypothetical protein X748_27855 [Mesorhizobium sp. LNJC386A00]|nr:hypothetical protein X748_27855 [Mesorhizobium sp. LNJC386A00]
METSALFELIAHRYERHSIAITANEPFSGWSDVFPGPAMTVAAIDRLVHHSTIIEMNGESYRKRDAVARGAGTQNANDEPENPARPVIVIDADDNYSPQIRGRRPPVTMPQRQLQLR